MSPRRRPFAALVLAAIVIVVACGDDDASSPADTAAGTCAVPASDPAAGAFPVTISHLFGQTVVPEEPQRVIVAGLNQADYLYSLGIAPVGVHEWFGGYPYAKGPWADAVREDLGAEPDVLEGFDVNVEWVASLDPDLIVVAYHDIDQTIYDQLSQIAPVVAAPSGPGVDVWAAPWRLQYRLIADAVGRRDRAE